MADWRVFSMAGDEALGLYACLCVRMLGVIYVLDRCYANHLIP
jgi:hypothetical protein